MSPRIARVIAIIVLTLAVPLPRAQSAERLLPLGAFSDVHCDTTAGDCFGSVLELWRSPRRLYGLFLRYEGPDADPATTSIDSVRFRPIDGRVHFVAHLVTGVHGDGSSVRERFVFDGTVRQSSVRGRLSRSTAPAAPVNWRRKDAEPLAPFESEAAWRRSWQQLSRVRTW